MVCSWILPTCRVYQQPFREFSFDSTSSPKNRSSLKYYLHRNISEKRLLVEKFGRRNNISMSFRRLRIPPSWDTTVGHRATALRRPKWIKTFRAFKIRTVRCSETSGYDYPMTRRHIPENWNPQQYRWDNLRCKTCGFTVKHKFSLIQTCNSEGACQHRIKLDTNKTRAEVASLRNKTIKVRIT